jgi:hypothetical protein
MATTNFSVPKALKPFLSKTLAPMLVKIGARKVSEGREEYKIKTVVGELFIHIQDNWVHCCFEDVAAARKHFKIDNIHQGRLNPFSGKWNWHWFDVNPAVLGNKSKDSKAALKLLADTVWREIEDLTPEAVAKSKLILAEHQRLMAK